MFNGIKIISIAVYLIMGIPLQIYAQIDPSWHCKDELISYMESPADTVYIQDRNTLEEVSGLNCIDSVAVFNYRSLQGDSLLIFIENSGFNPSDHDMDLSDTVYKFIHNEKRMDYLICKNLIDGKMAYGNDCSVPGIEISSIVIEWDGNLLHIPDNAFHNLFHAHLCLDYFPVEAYLTPDNQLLYIYIPGSDGAGSYAVKLIFDRTGYVTRIVSTNETAEQFDFLDAIGECF